MAEEKPTSKVGGWIKAGVTSVFGLLSGAVLMYVSPLVNNAIKPSKPLANFAQEIQGLTVTFQNRSTGGVDGWWDFGDGSALEHFNPNQDAITHAYVRPGMYTAKLSLRNFLGDENERAVTVSVDGSGGSGPVIEAFQVVPMGPEIAPATYRIVSKVKNANMVICDHGDGRPLDINNDPSSHDCIVTLKEPGSYKLRLVAFAGTKTVEATKDVWVEVGDFSAPGATLQVTYDAVHVQKKQDKINVSIPFPADHKESTYAFKEERRVDAGFHVLKAEFAQPVRESAVKNAKVEISADGTKFMVTGILAKPTGILIRHAPPPQWTTTVNVTMERRSTPQQKTTEPLMVNLNVPGSATLPVPPVPSGWEAQARHMNLEIRDHGKVVLNQSTLPAAANVQLKNRLCRITAIEQGGQIRVDVLDASATLRPTGN